MSFQNYSMQQNKPNLNVNQPPVKKQNSTVSKSVFKESLIHLDNQWDKWNNEMNELKKDASILETMFNKYDKDEKYLHLRDLIIKKIELKKSLLYELENK